MNQGFAWSIKSPDGRRKLFQKPIDNTRNERMMRTVNRELAPRLGTQGLEQKIENSMYESAVSEYGQEAADRAAQESIEAFNAAAIAGMTEEQCEAEQAAAFSAALTGT